MHVCILYSPSKVQNSVLFTMDFASFASEYLPTPEIHSYMHQHCTFVRFSILIWCTIFLLYMQAHIQAQNGEVFRFSSTTVVFPVPLVASVKGSLRIFTLSLQIRLALPNCSQVYQPKFPLCCSFESLGFYKRRTSSCKQKRGKG